MAITTSTPSNEVLPAWLFGIYINEVAKFFKDRFQSFKVNVEQSNTQKLQVVYGTPRAGFRYMLETNNGKMTLPLLSFYVFDFNRIMSMNKIMYLFEPATIDQVNGTIDAMRAPAHFTLNMNFNLFTNNNRERDRIMTELFQCMPLGDMWLHCFPDEVNYPKECFAIPLKIDEAVTDETMIEGLDIKDVRDVIRTVFNIQCTNAVVTMKIKTIPVVRKIESIVKQCQINSTNTDDYQFLLTKNLLDGKIIQS